jgi:hypothetical protein
MCLDQRFDFSQNFRNQLLDPAFSLRDFLSQAA